MRSLRTCVPRHHSAPGLVALAAMVCGAWSAAAWATSPPPYTIVSKDYPQQAEFCFYPGEWSGDLERVTLRYQLVIPPEHQGRYGDIFVGFRRPSDSSKLWLLGMPFPTTVQDGPGWNAYAPSVPPVANAMGQQLQPVTSIRVSDQPIDLRAFAGDGELLVGYGLRDNSVPGSTTSDSFREMVDQQRLTVVWRVSASQATRFGDYTCLKFSRLIQYVPGLGGAPR